MPKVRVRFQPSLWAVGVFVNRGWGLHISLMPLPCVRIWLDWPQRCRVCGCTDDQACEGGCWWIEADLCSACAEMESGLWRGAYDPDEGERFDEDDPFDESAELDRLREMVTRLEWSARHQHSNAQYCPICGGCRSEGHRRTCELDAVVPRELAAGLETSDPGAQQAAPLPDGAACGFVPPTPGWLPCTRSQGHDGPCAHPASPDGPPIRWSKGVL